MSAQHVRSIVDSMPGPEPGPFCRARLSISKLEGPLFGVEIKTKSEGQENCLLMISRCGTAVLWPEVNISETFYCSHVRCKTGRDAADISVAVECLQAACSIIIAAGSHCEQPQHKLALSTQHSSLFKPKKIN